jgi:hypothetical protein
MILSFGWTHHLLPPHGRKCETRRNAKSLTAWERQWDKDPSKVHQAWSKVPFAGGEKIGEFRLTHRPYLQFLCEMDAEAVAREGHPELLPEGFIQKYFWNPKKSWSEMQRQDEWDELIHNKPFCVIGFSFTPIADLPVEGQLSIFDVLAEVGK